MIQVENLVKTFDGFRALDGADFHVKKGAIYGLVGPNGAGKSTLIRHLTGIYKQDEGSVLIDGEPVFENPAVKEKIAYIPDDLFYFAQADTMEMKKFYEGIYPNFDAGLFEKIREAFPSIDTKQTIRRLSKGMQKQVAFWFRRMSVRGIGRIKTGYGKDPGEISGSRKRKYRSRKYDLCSKTR